MSQIAEESTVGTVTLAEVKHVAELAHLGLTEEETPRMQHDLNAMLKYVAKLGELDTKGVPEMAQVSEILESAEQIGSETAHGHTLRTDAVRPSVDRAAVMADAPETDGKFFKVPKVIEK